MRTRFFNMTQQSKGDNEMTDKIYFSKVFFVEKSGLSTILSVLTVDLDQGEMSFQRFARRGKRQMPGGRKIELFYYDGELIDIWDNDVPARMIRSGRNNWKAVCLETDTEREINFSKGIKLDDNEVNELRKYCNAEEFEPYRNRKMSMDDEGFIGYRDEITMEFYGITNDYIPFLHLPMHYFYDEKHIWPSERLYRYINQKYYGKLSTMKDMDGKNKKGKKRKSGEGMYE